MNDLFIISCRLCGRTVDAFFDETQKGRVFSSMIEVRLTTDHDDYWELKYMLDDAKEKAANKQFDELTEEQQALLAYTEPTLQTTIYWGKKFFRQQCYSSGVGVLSFYFSVLSSPLDRIAGAWQGRILCDLLSYRFCLSHIRAF